MYICIYCGAKEKRIGISKTEHHTFVFSFFRLLKRMKKKSKNTQIHGEKNKGYGETLLAIITRLTNGCASARKNEIKENVKLTTKILAH